MKMAVWVVLLFVFAGLLLWLYLSMALAPWLAGTVFVLSIIGMIWWCRKTKNKKEGENGNG
jgi:Flp pilus assembly protein TadB